MSKQGQKTGLKRRVLILLQEKGPLTNGQIQEKLDVEYYIGSCTSTGVQMVHMRAFRERGDKINRYEITKAGEQFLLDGIIKQGREAKTKRPRITIPELLVDFYRITAKCRPRHTQ